MSRIHRVRNFQAVLIVGLAVSSGNVAAESPSPTREQRFALEDEAEALLKKYWKDDGSGSEAFKQQVGAFEEKVKSAGAASGNVARWVGKLTNHVAQLKKRGARLGVAKQDQRILAGAVMERFPGKYKLSDSMNLEKVSAAFAESDLKDYVMTARTKADTRRHRYWPAVHDHDSEPRAARSEKDPAHKPVLMWRNGVPAHLYVVSPPELEAANVALVWGVLSKRDVLIVTLDGGRYRSEIQGVMNGIMKPEAWPAPLAFTNLHPRDIAALAQAGQLPAKRQDDWDAAIKGASACSKGVWDAAEPQFAAIRKADILERTRQNRLNALNDKMSKRLNDRCQKWMTKAESAWKAASAARVEARRAAFERNKAKLLERISALKVATGP